MIYSSGDDNKILGIDYHKRKVVSEGIVSLDEKLRDEDKGKTPTAATLSYYPVHQQSRALAYCKENGHIAVSNNYGSVSIRQKSNLTQEQHFLSQPREWNEVMKYSPCGAYLAVGSHDNKIYIYKVSDGYSLYATFDKHNSFVTALDWSVDSTYIRSICGAYEKLYFNVTKKEFDNSGMTNTKDLAWDSLSIKKGWDVDGTRPSSEDGSHINGVDRS